MDLQVFKNSHFGELRAIIRDGDPWIIAKDVCHVLSINNHRDAITRLDDDERESVLVDTLGGQQTMSAINESGLYSLIMVSRKPEARRFKKWVTSDVLPSIRKTGMYRIGDFPIPKTLPEALRLAADLIEQNETLKPKAAQHDLFLTGQNCQPMNEVAKSLNCGRNKLIKYLRDRGILMRNNNPYQDYIDRGYFKVIEKTITIGENKFNKTQTLVTSKGVEYIAKLLLKEKSLI